MASLIDLPDEILVYVLSLSEPRAVVWCQQVCYKLRSLVTTSPILTYILALYSLGYVQPRVPRSDLTLPECIAILHEHRLRWSRIRALPATRYNLDATQYSRTQYVGGVYAHGIMGSWAGFIHTMHFYQLESRNLGTSFNKWTLHNLGWGAKLNLGDFAIDPEQDLLILAETAAAYSYPTPDSIPQDVCRIYLRTMSTGETHPKALEPVMIVSLKEPQQSGEFEEGRFNEQPVTGEFEEDEFDGQPVAAPHRSCSFEVSGALVVIRFRTVHGAGQQWIVILDWCRGVEVTRIPERHLWNPSSVLLSREMILIPRYYTAPELPSQAPDIPDACGSLDLYSFDPFCDSSTPPHMIASFGLPTSDRNWNYTISGVTVRCTPSVNTLAADGSSKPKVYDLSSQDRLISLTLTALPNDLRFGEWSIETISAGTLYMPLSLFIDLWETYCNQAQDNHGSLMPPGPTRVPWHMWGYRTSWVDTGDISIFSSSSHSSTFGHRLVVPWVPDGRSSSWTTEVLLVGFDQRRVSWEHQCAGEQDPMFASNTDANNGRVQVGSSGGIGRGIFCREGVSAQTTNAQTLIPIDGAMNCQTDYVYADGEHIIVARHPRVFSLGREPRDEGTLSVYTF